MILKTAYQPGQFGLSFELFPPKTEAGEASLYEHVQRLVEFAPAFITCTYGAGGSTRDKTLAIVQEVKRRFSLPTLSHLTCVGATVEQLRDYLLRAQRAGIDGIVALRGDPPQGECQFVATQGGLRYANELVALIRAEFPGFDIAVAGYPETHQEAADAAIDLANLKRKAAAGADCIVTQLFYDNRDFFDFRDRVQQAGIETPVVPGIMPVTNLKQIQKITSLCGAKLPAEFLEKLAQRDDPQWQFEVGVEQATGQVQELIDRGVPGIHFYVLNKSDATAAVLSALNRS